MTLSFSMGTRRDRLPPGNYLFFASVPLIPGVEAGEKIEGQPFLDWDESHPILRHVPVQAMTVFSWLKLKLPREAIPLIEGADGPVMALMRASGTSTSCVRSASSTRRGPMPIRIGSCRRVCYLRLQCGPISDRRVNVGPVPAGPPGRGVHRRGKGEPDRARRSIGPTDAKTASWPGMGWRPMARRIGSGSIMSRTRCPTRKCGP